MRIAFSIVLAVIVLACSKAMAYDSYQTYTYPLPCYYGLRGHYDSGNYGLKGSYNSGWYGNNGPYDSGYNYNYNSYRTYRYW